MAHRRFTRSRGRQGARRETSWLPIPFGSDGIAAGAAITHVLTTAEKAKRPFTVLRTHIELSISSDQIVASEDVFNGLGVCVVSDQAVSVGATAVPTPIADLGSDLWFVIQPMFSELIFLDATGMFLSGTRYTIDSKAMRKVNEDQDIVIVMENSASLGGGSVVQSAGRILIQES